MLIGTEWKIEADSLNVVLYRKTKRVKKDAKEPYEVWKTVGYFASVANALHALVELKIKESELKDLNTVVAKINEVHTLIDLQCATATTGVGKH